MENEKTYIWLFYMYHRIYRFLNVLFLTFFGADFFWYKDLTSQTKCIFLQG
jgi:hypothetical protein